MVLKGLNEQQQQQEQSTCLVLKGLNGTPSFQRPLSREFFPHQKHPCLPLNRAVLVDSGNSGRMCHAKVQLLLSLCGGVECPACFGSVAEVGTGVCGWAQCLLGRLPPLEECCQLGKGSRGPQTYQPLFPWRNENIPSRLSLRSTV